MVQMDSLRELMKKDSPRLFHLASRTTPLMDDYERSWRDPRKHLAKTTFLHRLGIAENSEEMANAARQFGGRADKLQERLDCFVRSDLDANVVSDLVKQAPTVHNQSKDTTKENAIIFGVPMVEGKGEVK
ncbi:hypothetical protein SAY87_014586 [Trapa incisa]|uniref:Uncharacterized protein n=1 Tax=Trapa incisa TaxID=236973 RepID=A0AAN7JLA0_9MYRT|nr:hypothetical protein SAY87_014586 [Trapa incisa]